MKVTLEQYLGAGGRLEDLFDPKRKDSALSKILSIFDEHFKGRDSVLYKLLNHADPESPIAALKQDLIENYLKDIRDHLVGKKATEAERERGTAKGREYQEDVYSKINEILSPFQDIPDRVWSTAGKLPGKLVGDIVVTINPSYTAGAPLRVVLEAKDRSGYSLNKILAELDEAKQNRDASVALAVFTSDTCPNECYPLQQYGDDKLICCYDPEDENCLAIGLAYRVCRIEALRKLRGVAPQIDASEMATLINQCLEKLKMISSIKRKVTKLSNEVNEDLNTLNTELESVLNQLDARIQKAGTL